MKMRSRNLVTTLTDCINDEDRGKIPLTFVIFCGARNAHPTSSYGEMCIFTQSDALKQCSMN